MWGTWCSSRSFGADRIPIVSRVDRALFGYFGSKLAAGRIVSDSGVPWTTLRATQFHDLQLTVAKQMAKVPVIPVPAGVRFQPIDADEVAARLVELTLGRPAGLVPDMAGPRVYEMAHLVRGYLRAHHKHRLKVPVRLPGKAASALRAGAYLSPEGPVGHRTWEDFLAQRAVPKPELPDRRWEVRARALASETFAAVFWLKGWVDPNRGQT